MMRLHGLGAAVGPALAGALMGITAASALPLFFALMFSLIAVYALRHLRQGDDRIVDGAAHQVPMVRTSTAVLEMMLEEASGDEVAGSNHAADGRETARDEFEQQDGDHAHDVGNRP